MTFLKTFALLVVLGALVCLIPATSAQDQIQIRYGENRIADVTTDTPAQFAFIIDAGVSMIEVWGVDFAPSVTLTNERGDRTLATNDNPEGENRVILEYNNVGQGLVSGTVIVTVNAPAGQSGPVAVRLTRRGGSTGTASSGNPIQAGQSFTGSVAPGGNAATYSFPASPDNTLEVSVRSITQDFFPVISLLTQDGTVVGTLNSDQAYGASYLLRPGEGTYQLAVESGDFGEAAEFAVSLATGPTVGNDGTIGYEVPQTGCSLTSDTQVNIRSGGSVDHETIGVLGQQKYLIVLGYSNDNGVWYSVGLPDGRSGWISSTVTILEGSCDNLTLRTFLPPE